MLKLFDLIYGFQGISWFKLIPPMATQFLLDGVEYTLLFIYLVIWVFSIYFINVIVSSWIFDVLCSISEVLKYYGSHQE